MSGAPDWDPGDKKGEVGAPVNCCTMALKLVVSVLKRVVGPFLEALDLFLVDFPILPSTFRWLLLLPEMVDVVLVVVVVAMDSAAASGTPPKNMDCWRGVGSTCRPMVLPW